MRRIILLFSSGLGSGYIPFASGTWGTLVAILFYWPMAGLNRLPRDGGRPWLYGMIVMAVIVLGTWASSYAESVYKAKDSGKIVIDEIAGFFIAVLFIPWHWGWMLAAFFVFRLFDVWKPWPIDRLQRLHGGVGVMIDDVLAGVYTCLLLHLVRVVIAAMR